MARRRHRFEKAPKFRGAAYIWLLIAILISASVWGVSARYIHQREQDILAKAKMFYFTSNLLTEEQDTKYILNPGTTSVEIILKNHTDSLRFSEDNIQYNIYVNDAKQGETELLTGGITSQGEFILTVESRKTYTVRAEGNAGYTKNLYATFEVLDTPKHFYKHVDAEDKNVVLLTVWTEDLSGEVTVQFPAELIPDTTGGTWAAITNYEGGSYTEKTTAAVPLGTYGSITYRFFKDTPGKAYTINQFNVLLKTDTQEITAIKGIPEVND